MKTISIITIMLIGRLGLTHAALPPDEHARWVQEFMDATDVVATAAFDRVDLGIWERLKRVAGKPSVCRAVYRVKDVIRQPSGFGLTANDTIELEYPCAQDLGMDWSGSLLPWVKPFTANQLEITARSSDFLIENGSYVLDNSKNIFGPIFPPGIKTGLTKKPRWNLVLLAYRDWLQMSPRKKKESLAEYKNRYGIDLSQSVSLIVEELEQVGRDAAVSDPEGYLNLSMDEILSMLMSVAVLE